jgi:glycosyltransferase involved in cell wall biosynthesis
VIVPAYNAAATLGATLASARGQTLRDLELIVVDDGSRDPTPAVLAELGLRDQRLRVIRQANAGVSAARNAGLRAARADIIAFLDSDDLWAPGHLARHVQRLRDDRRLGVSFSTARFIDAHGQVHGQAQPRLAGLTPVDFLTGNPTTTTSCLVARRGAFETAGLFDATLARSEDQEWLFRAAHRGVRIEGVADPLVDYRTSNRGLASDLEAMRAGFEAMLSRAAAQAPALVARHAGFARACEYLYLARRSRRLGVAPDVTLRYLASALRADPTVAWRRARTVAGVAALCVLGEPGAAPVQVQGA